MLCPPVRLLVAAVICCYVAISFASIRHQAGPSCFHALVCVTDDFETDTDVKIASDVVIGAGVNL